MAQATDNLETTRQDDSSKSEKSDLQSRRSSELVGEKGRIAIADSVVAKIAGIAAREIPGVHKMGSGSARAFGAIRDRLPVGGEGLAQGIKVEVGQREAAIDADIVVEYGMSIVDVSQGVRRNVIDRIEGMTGLQVKEVNVFVDDIWTGEEKSEEQPRVS
ncbi:MAG TPA: Asp23/Gls24 family envelope stress response protein [Actinomycetota bacterium]|nr:Asp23/Gls24 family envelope stress response protein [Actinomycetota bacterium]